MPVGAIYSAGTVGWRIHIPALCRDRHYRICIAVGGGIWVGEVYQVMAEVSESFFCSC